MDSDNLTAVVIPLPEPRLEHAETGFDKVVGDTCFAGAGRAPDAGLITEHWLDCMADELSEQAWLELDLTSRLPAGLLSALLNEVRILERTEAMSRAGIGRGADLLKDRSVRRDKISWLDGYTEPQARLFAFFDQLMAGLNQRLFLGLKRYEAHYATYQPGDFYKRHLDSFRGALPGSSVW